MNSEPNTKLSPTYPKGRHLITTESSWWTLPLQHVKALDGKYVFAGEFTSPTTGNTVTVQTPAELKRGHQKLFNVLLHLWYSRNKTFQDELSKEIKALLDTPKSKTTSKDETKAIQQLKKKQLLELLGKDQLQQCKKHSGIEDFETLINQSRRFVSSINNDTFTLKLVDLMTECDYKDHRKTQRQLMIAQIETLQMTIIKAHDKKAGSFFSYPLIAEWSFNEQTGEITIKLNSDLMNSTAGLIDGHTTRFCSLGVSNKLKSMHSVDLLEHLQMLGRGRQSSGLFGVVIEVSFDELVRKLNLTNHLRPDKMINKCFKEIQEITGIKYCYNRIYKTYHLTNDSKLLKDTA